MKNINHTRSSISDDIRNILCSSANMRRAIPLILRLLMRSEERFSRNAETDLVCRRLLEKKKSNLNVHYSMPFFGRAELGMPISYSLSYASPVWQIGASA